MAWFLRLCPWLLLLGPGLLATVRAECSQDCATCSYRLVRPADINFLVSVARGECCAPCETVSATVRGQSQAHSGARMAIRTGSEPQRREPVVTWVSQLFLER